MKCPKVSETSERGSLDRISSLPDELLGYILSFLPTLHAVRTGVLSIRWRYLFTLTTNLSFDDQEYFCSHVKPCSRNKTLANSFTSFVYGVLALHRLTPIQKFSLKLIHSGKYDVSHFLVWITSAMLKEVKHLDIDIPFRQISLPNCFFDSQTLVRLEISSMIVGLDLKVPRIVCLPSLRFLKLNEVTFLDDESFIRFFVGCSQLKELILLHCALAKIRVCVSALKLEKLTVCFCRGHVEIDAPILSCFSYMCPWPNKHVDMSLKLKKSCSPSRVEVGLICYKFYGHMPRFVIRLITRAQNARELILKSSALKLLTKVDVSRLPTYPKLESLRFDFCPSITWKYVTFWLAKSPKLKTIVFKEGLLGNIIRGAEDDWDASKELAPFSSTVETIEAREFKGQKLELILVKYLLENAGALKRLILYKSGLMNIEEELQVRTELQMLPKASSYCTIELKEPIH